MLPARNDRAGGPSRWLVATTESGTRDAIDDPGDLLAPFLASEKPRAAWRVGTEAEKFGMHASGRPARFKGEIDVILQRLAERHGWVPQQEHPDRPVIALSRGGANITLEPGGQLELSGAPVETIHATELEFGGHLAEVDAASADLGLHWLGLGFHPLARQADLPWVPKLRYGVMRQYLPTRGRRALDMMRRTATVQANLDYSNADDAFRKLRVGLRLQPVVGALFANAPWYEGRATGHVSHRLEVWEDVDPDRTGLLTFLWEGPADYRRYVDWALDAPMFLIVRGGVAYHNTGQTFRAFLRDGFEGLRATRQDWDTHLNTLFPDARLKRTLEMRGADGQQRALVPAVPALWKGLLYDEATLAKAETLASTITPEAALAARHEIPRSGLRARLGRRSVADWAGDVLELAEAGLARLGNLDAEGRDERRHLAPLRALLAAGKHPADVVREAAGDAPSAAALMTHARA